MRHSFEIGFLKIYSVALHKFQQFLSHSAIHGKLVHGDAWRVASVRTALIVGRSSDTIASTFPHWLLIFRQVVGESTTA